MHEAEAVFIADAQGVVIWVSKTFQALSGFAPDEVVGKSIAFLGISELIDSSQQELSLRLKSGVVTPVTASISTVSPGSLRAVSLRADPAQAALDAATGLPPRNAFRTLLQSAVDRATDSRAGLAVVLLDVDRGPDRDALAAIVRRLRQSLRAGDAVARFGGDEFAVLLENFGDPESARPVVERILSGLERPANAGCAFFPADGDSASSLIHNADLALYRSKSEGRHSYRFFDSGLQAEVTEKLSIERELGRALGTRSLWLAYQPQWDLRTGRLRGAETLLRWSASGELPMTKIIRVAEETGMILPIGQWVIKAAVAESLRWRRRGSPVVLSLNLSAVQLQRQDVAPIIIESLRAFGVEPRWLQAEITESVLLSESPRVRQSLETLHAAGVGLVLDDFGTGYSSLTYLRQFPVDMVKIDSSFVAGLGQRKTDEAIVSGIIGMAHSLGRKVAAEGVETELQLEFLKAAGCDLAQGYYYAKALSGSDFETYLATHWTPEAAEAKA